MYLSDEFPECVSSYAAGYLYAGRQLLVVADSERYSRVLACWGGRSVDGSQELEVVTPLLPVSSVVRGDGTLDAQLVQCVVAALAATIEGGAIVSGTMLARLVQHIYAAGRPREALADATCLLVGACPGRRERIVALLEAAGRVLKRAAVTESLGICLGGVEKEAQEQVALAAVARAAAFLQRGGGPRAIIIDECWRWIRPERRWVLGLLSARQQGRAQPVWLATRSSAAVPPGPVRVLKGTLCGQPIDELTYLVPLASKGWMRKDEVVQGCHGLGGGHVAW